MNQQNERGAPFMIHFAYLLGGGLAGGGLDGDNWTGSHFTVYVTKNATESFDGELRFI